MNFLKVINFIASALILAGFIMMIGAVGTCDYMDEIGEYYPVSKELPNMIEGVVMLGAGALMSNWLDKNFDYYEQEGDEE